MENQEKVHKRRVRYSGTHPKNYKEKYKEHNPEKYADTIAKVIQKGSTPAGMHISIMVQEILDFLQIKPGMTGLDATLGYGGHTKAMLQKLEGNGHIYALDVDPIQIQGVHRCFHFRIRVAKVDQAAERLDIIRFYYHHWMLFAVPFLMVTFGIHKPSYKHILRAPTILLIVMLFIILNQVFQMELGFIPMSRYPDNFFNIGYKNTSYIWGPGTDDAIGNFFKIFTPKFFKTVPVGEFAGQEKYWPWFWMICPVYILVTPLSFIVASIADRKRLGADIKKLFSKKQPVA